MAKRSGKFYRKNEAEVMKALGLEPTPGSGCGWVIKEDGQNDNVVCQLKSTDAQSISVKKLDIDKLEHNALVEKKLPVFAIQFLQSNEVFLLVRPEHLQEVSEYIDTGEVQTLNDFLGIDSTNVTESISEPLSKGRNIVKSSSSAREMFMRERMEKYARERKSAL